MDPRDAVVITSYSIHYTKLYDKENREDWRRKIDNTARLSRADRLWKEIDYLTELAEESEKDLLKEARKHAAIKILRSRNNFV